MQNVSYCCIIHLNSILCTIQVCNRVFKVNVKVIFWVHITCICQYSISQKEKSTYSTTAKTGTASYIFGHCLWQWNLNSLLQKMLCALFGSNWPSGREIQKCGKCMTTMTTTTMRSEQILIKKANFTQGCLLPPFWHFP